MPPDGSQTTVNNGVDDQRTTSVESQTTNVGSTSGIDVREALGDVSNDIDRPYKKRKLTDRVTPQQHSTPRTQSPPWKKVAAEGPTTFLDPSGKRRSGRTNALPLELQPQSDKRKTRAAAVGQQTNGSVKGRYPSSCSPQDVKHQRNISSHNTPTRPSSSFQSKPKHVRQVSKTESHVSLASPGRPKSRRGTVKLENWPTTPINGKHRKVRFEASQSPKPETQVSRTRRRRRSLKAMEAEAAELKRQLERPQSRRKKDATQSEDEGQEKDDEENEEEDDETSEGDDMELTPVAADYKLQRLKFNVRMPTLPIPHPTNLVQRKHHSFRDFLETVHSQQYSDYKPMNEKEIRREAFRRGRLLKAAEPGGPLSCERCSRYQPEPADEPVQFAHWDHLVAHAENFKRLMDREGRRHRSEAKKLADACQARWDLIRPKSEEEEKKAAAEAEVNILETKWKQIITDIEAKWALFRTEMDKARLATWEREREALGKKALNKVLEQSTQLLDARRRGSEDLGSGLDVGSDEEDDNSDESGSGGDNHEGQDDNISSSESEDEEEADRIDDGDESLTVEELQKKYSAPVLGDLDRPPDKADNEDAIMADFETRESMDPDQSEGEAVNSWKVATRAGRERTDASALQDPDEAVIHSDESVDMDDDMGSSDADSSGESGVEDSDEDESGEADDTGYSLAGFLSGQERNALATADPDPDPEDEVSLIAVPDAAQVQTPAASNADGPIENVREQVKDGPSKLSIVTTNTPTEPEEQDAAMPDEPEETKEMSLPATPVSSKALKTQVPSLLRATLREYQHYGLDWLAGLYANGTNGILADEMGLGKTIQTIALLAHLAIEYGIWGPHLIVVPTSVMLNWEVEFKKFLPGFKILTYYGTQEERRVKRKGWLNDDLWNVVITSYNLVIQDQVSFKKRGWHYLVLDEAHNIKNWKSARWQTLLTFRSHRRLLLTGTPLQNNLSELWSLMFFLMPSDEEGSRFTGLEEFTGWFKKPVNQILEQGNEKLDAEGQELVRRLHTVLRPYLLRRLKADVEKQMPGKYEHVVYCKLSKRQRYLYDGFMSRASTRDTLASGNYLSIINALMQLRKVCNHPDLFETRQIVTSFAMHKSAVADYEIKDLIIRRKLLNQDALDRVDLGVINLLPAAVGPVSPMDTIQNRRIGARDRLSFMIAQHSKHIDPEMRYNGSTIRSSLEYMKTCAHKCAMRSLEHQWYLVNARSQQRSITSQSTVNFIRRKLAEQVVVKRTVTSPGALIEWELVERKRGPVIPSIPAQRTRLSDWLTCQSRLLEELTPSFEQRASAMQPYIARFGCVTPSVVAHGIDALTIGKTGMQVAAQLRAPLLPTISPSVDQALISPKPSVDPLHESQMRLSIAFPDKRLLQYDCGKLQKLDVLLRTLQSRGSRALIFTQMTKVLDILEQFLNIHGHRYLRLDGSTKIEQRQILTDRFNNDNRILAFILSSRSGGLGINLTGADSVIFYDLDWNPAMDKQCQDRSHRIGQTRDVHIYRMVSEYTIEMNILRKANQKRLLDDVIIQDGDFTTERFNHSQQAGFVEGEDLHEADQEASAAMDRVLGAAPGQEAGTVVSTKLLAQVEEKEDVAAAAVAEKEGLADEVDFEEKGKAPMLANTPARTPATAPTAPTDLVTATRVLDETVPRTESNLNVRNLEEAEFFSGAVRPTSIAQEQIFTEKEGYIGIDRHIVGFLEWEIKEFEIAFVPPDDLKKKKRKKGGDYSVRKR